MITINGQKMGKSLGNFINLEEFFSGSHKLLEQSYSPMTIRFFILQAHYRSPVDFSNEGLKAAEKGLSRLLNAAETLQRLSPSATSTSDVPALERACYEAMDDDLNTAITLSHLFEGARIINSVHAGTETISATDLESLQRFFPCFVFDILGLRAEVASDHDSLDALMQMILKVRSDAKAGKDFATSDKIRNELEAIGFRIKDEKSGTTWTKD
jgi:cysteinyl-tRNA synthetase